jgi:hypothetical protein
MNVSSSTDDDRQEEPAVTCQAAESSVLEMGRDPLGVALHTRVGSVEVSEDVGGGLIRLSYGDRRRPARVPDEPHVPDALLVGDLQGTPGEVPSDAVHKYPFRYRVGVDDSGEGCHIRPWSIRCIRSSPRGVLSDYVPRT